MKDINYIPDWILLNNKVVDENGQIADLRNDKEAAKSYFINHVNKKTQFFHSLKEKIEYMIEEGYYEEEFLNKYSFEQIREIYDIAYDAKFRFPSYMSAFKFYNDYALRDKTGEVFLERYEDRLSVVALYHANGDFELAKSLIKALIAQDFTPATPTLLNTGRKHRGEMVSCFLLNIDDSLNDIARAQEFAMQLSKRGGGVSLNLTNLRAKGESIKNIPNATKGVVGVIKLLDNAFRYADQMGQRQGAGAVYLNVFHSDIEDFLATKKLNADDDVRAKTLSLGVVMPDKMIELAREDKDMYVFYPHTVTKEYGKPFSEIAVEMDVWYDKLISNPNVRKRKINPRKLLDTIAQLQGESGYPYIMFADNVNRKGVNPVNRNVEYSNLCSEILQPSELSHYADYDKREEEVIGMDISCNLASGNIVNMIKHNSIKETVYAAMQIMTSVSKHTNITAVPGIAKANAQMRSVGFGIMNLHGFFASNYMMYGSEESIEAVDVFFNIVNFYSLKFSNETAKKEGSTFYKYEQSAYADGTYFEGRGQILPTSEVVKEIFKDIYIPTDEDWKQLANDVAEHGLYHSHRLAIAPTGSISYVMNATAGATPIRELVEQRTYGNSKTYYPMPFSDTAGFMYETAYTMDNYKIIDVIATIQKHVDQGISFELCINSDITTRTLQRYYLYAHHKGIKTLYYTRTRKLSVEECLACAV